MIPGARLAIFGKQGAGKGTQAFRLARHYVVPNISTGEIFRAAVKSGSEFGRRAKVFMDDGDLVPDDVVIGMVRERLTHDDARNRGFLLDGFPRTVMQAEAMEEMLSPAGIDLVIYIDVPTEAALRRLAGRRVCVDCGTNYSVEQHPDTNWTCDVCHGRVIEREDDTTAAIARRLSLYEQQTNPLIDWYSERDRLVTIDGLGDRDTITARLIPAIDERLKRATRC